MKDMKKIMCCAGCGILLTTMVCALGCNCDKKAKLKREFIDMVDDAVEGAIESITNAADRIMTAMK